MMLSPALFIVQLARAASSEWHSTPACVLPVQGYLYQLDEHLDRFYVSAHKAAIVPPFSRPQLRRIILETAAASQKFDGRTLKCVALICLPGLWSLPGRQSLLHVCEPISTAHLTHLYALQGRFDTG